MNVTYNPGPEPLSSDEAHEPGTYIVDMRGTPQRVWFCFEEGAFPLLISEGWEDGSPFSSDERRTMDYKRRAASDAARDEWAKRKPEVVEYIKRARFVPAASNDTASEALSRPSMTPRAATR